MRELPTVETKVEFVAFNGGLDVVSPPLAIPPGSAREAQNYEQDINGGYAPIVGYERFSGKAKPSDASYAVLTCDITGSVSVGDVLTDDAATSFGTVIALPTGQAILTLITGTFSTGNIKVSGVVVGTCTDAQVTDGAATSLLHAQYKNLAADVYRALIAAVPGSGNIRGVWLYNDAVYALRDNAGATACVMHKSTTSGWSAVALGRELKFSTGTAAVAEGATLTGATSGATGVVTRISLESGSYGAGTAAGHFIFASIVGTFQNGENLQVAGVTKAVAVGADAAITFAVPGGRFEFINKNFGGSANTTRMYGCDGRNRAFEFDGTVFVPINTGMTSDAPTHISAFKNQLFLSFGGSVQHSAPGQPYVWNAVLGAAELAVGDTVTGFQVQPSGNSEGALAIFCRNNISVLYGSTVLDWELNPLNAQAGGIAYTIQHIGQTVMLDDRGLTSLAATQAYGNFASATLSKRIQTWLKQRRSLATASTIIRDKNQYRVFFSDGSALFVTMDPTSPSAPFGPGGVPVVGMLPQVFPNAVRCACSGEMSDGTEVAFFGSSDGYIYQMERGTSFDGAEIEAYLNLVFNHSKSPRQLKCYRRATFEVAGTGYAEVNFSYQLGYGTTSYEQSGVENVVAALRPAYWDTFTWDAFTWDGAALTPTEVDLVGTAENVSFMFRSKSDYFQPLRISGALVQFSPRRNLR
jgi:hypothetical protein